jgi:lipoprotein signal peptidase
MFMNARSYEKKPYAGKGSRMKIAVVDFISVGVGSLRTGIFNVADLAIVLGFALVVIRFRQGRE